MDAEDPRGAAPAEPEAGKTDAEELEAKIAEARSAEGQPDDPGDPAAAGQEEDPELAEGAVQDGEVQGLSPEAQAAVNERIHGINVKRKNAEAQAKELETKIKELEARDAQVVQDALRMGLTPEYVTPAEVAQIKRYEALKAERAWLTRHRDGYEGSGAAGDPVLSAADVAEREAQVADELSDLAPQTKTLMREKAEQMLADMKMGRSIRTRRVQPKAGGPAPSVLPRAALKKPAPGKKPEFTSKTFSARGGGRAALEEMIASKF
ncbi:MAG: hypothetical protein PHX05_00145 [Acidobacteriota bacterium]|nr:hypothetical protein [Acidobacteriota bacterium]